MKLIWKEKSGRTRTIHFFGIKFSYKKKLKQDITSEVELYLIDAFEIYHYLPIYNELLKAGINARIVAEPCEINSAKYWFDYDTAVKILQENRINFCTKANENAKYAITTQRADILSKYKGKKVNLSYGCGFTKNYFINNKDTCIGFDYKLAHGAYSKELLSRFMNIENIKIIGYPKHINFFKSNITKESVKKELKIKTDKPIAVYFPTWDEGNSVNTFSEGIKRIKKDFYIVTKPHHCTFRLEEKKDELKKIYEISDTVLDANYPFEKAAILGDIALVDAKSGASTEVPYLNKDISLLLLIPCESSKQNYVDKTFEFANVTSTSEDFENIISDIYKNDRFKRYRKDFIHQIYADCILDEFIEIIKKDCVRTTGYTR